ncbi:MAG: hypothetical protein ACXVIF_04215 [Halobacteriota archaeon]
MLHPKVTAAFAVAALMTLAVVTAGCTTPTNPTPSPTPTPVVQTITTAGNNTTLTSTAGFRMTFPSQYKYDQNGSTNPKLIIYLDPKDATTDVSSGVDTLQPGTTLDAYTDFIKDLPLNYKNLTIIQNLTDTTLGGKPAKTHTYQAVLPIDNGTSVKNQRMQVQEIWTINNDKGFVVVYRAPPSNFTRFLPEAQKIINSFQLT